MGKPDGTSGKLGLKLEKCQIYPWLWGIIFSICLWNMRTSPLHLSDSKYPFKSENKEKALKKLCFRTNFHAFPSPKVLNLLHWWSRHEWSKAWLDKISLSYDSPRKWYKRKSVSSSVASPNFMMMASTIQKLWPFCQPELLEFPMFL